MKVRITQIAAAAGEKCWPHALEGEAVYPPTVGDNFVVNGGELVWITPEVTELHGPAFTTETGSRYVVELLERLEIAKA